MLTTSTLHAAEPAPDSHARLPASESKQVIQSVLAGDEFQPVRKEKLWLPRFKSKDKDRDSPEPSRTSRWGEGLSEFAFWLAESFRALLWLGVAVLILLLFIYRDRWLGMFSHTRRVKTEWKAPETLFGLAVTPESLPNDIPAAARQALRGGDRRGALSLLYRGALRVLIEHDGLHMQSNHTESDVLRLARGRLNARRGRYLEQLTQLWQTVAWGHRQPADEQIASLCDQWPRHFRTTS